MTTAFDQGRVPPIELRHRLRIAREYAGYEQGELAEVIGVGRNTISNAEKGARHPRKIVVNAWAMACGVPAVWLETGIPPQDGPPNSDLRIISASSRFTRTTTRTAKGPSKRQVKDAA